MFTGIIEELGEVVAVQHGGDSARLTIRGPAVTADARTGSSISVNGVCLTVTAPDSQAPDSQAPGVFTADVMAETLRRSALAELRAGSKVNLERPLAVDGRLGGHIVQGHVDGLGTVLERTPGERWEVVRIGCSESLIRYLAEKGSVAVDGVSLTVVTVHEDGDDDGGADAHHARPSFTVSLIPQTLQDTTLGSRTVGDLVNLEVDILAKYVERLLA